MSYIKLILVLVVLFAFAGLSQAQLSVAVHGSYNITSFEKQESAASGLGIGANLDFTALPILDVGAEFDYLVSPFKFEQSVTVLGSTVNSTNEFSQMLVGVYGKVYMPMLVIDPYARVGVGYYTGKIKAKGESNGQTLYDEEEKFKSKIGFNVGVGVSFLMGLYGEVVYHMVSREIDNPEVLNSGSFGYNYWAINVGYAF